jgi:hypothetical protein
MSFHGPVTLHPPRREGGAVKPRPLGAHTYSDQEGGTFLEHERVTNPTNEIYDSETKEAMQQLLDLIERRVQERLLVYRQALEWIRDNVETHTSVVEEVEQRCIRALAGQHVWKPGG